MKETNLILKELKKVLARADRKKVKMLVNEIISSSSIKTIGHGRSGYVGECFSMRLKHLGLKTGNGLLIVISGSGLTKDVLQKVRKTKAKTVLITINGKSLIAKKADLVIELKAGKSKQPMRSLFEQAALVYLDAVIMLLMKKLKISEKEMWRKHD